MVAALIAFLAFVRLSAVSAHMAHGQLLAMRDRNNGTDAQPIWVFPPTQGDKPWEVEGAGKLTGNPLTMNAVSALDTGRPLSALQPQTPPRLFTLRSDDDNGGFSLSAFEAIHGKTTFTPFPNGRFVVGGSFAYAPARDQIVAMVGCDGNGSAVQLSSWSIATGDYTVLFAFPTGYKDAFDYGAGFVAPAQIYPGAPPADDVYWAFLYHEVRSTWDLIGVNLRTSALVQPVSPLHRAAGQCSDTLCLQKPIGFVASINSPGLAYGLDIDTVDGAAGFQVAELNLSTSAVRPIGKVPARQNFDLGLHFLATPWPGLPWGPADELYYTLLAGGEEAPTIYGVNVTRGGDLVSADTPWPTGAWPSFAHWLPTEP